MFPIRDHHPSSRFPLVTILIITINCFIFFLEMTAPDLDQFIAQYALLPATVNFLNPLTLVPFLTSMFLHGGWLHILSNMWFLWIFGDNIEATLGSIGFLMFYLFAGFAASLLQFFIDPTSVIPVLGASGAIAGVLGGYLVLFPRAQIETLVTLGYYVSRINVSAQIMLIYWFITQLFSGVGSLAIGVAAQGGVAFFAHIGGFAAGWLLTQLFIKPRLKWQIA
ncbi:TPA: rhomboid family intramembrane serine protease [Patescibacteria group bacterium]|nr:rhomboid family intramembrane serine protease [Patescibacteria group bacterium]